MAAHLDAFALEPREQTRFDVGREYGAGGTDPLGEHRRQRASSRAHVQAAPARADSDRVQLTNAQRVMKLLQQPQAKPLEVRCVPLLKEILSQAPVEPILCRGTPRVNPGAERRRWLLKKISLIPPTLRAMAAPRHLWSGDWRRDAA